MIPDVDVPMGRVPTLVQLCQRVAQSNIDYISGLGDDLTYELVRPILERCSAEQLLRLEETSPHLEADTDDIWMSLCHSVYSLAVNKYSRGPKEELRPWKDHYFYLREAETQRLEEASAKLRTQRLEAEERKKEREVKITDRIPPPKRQRTGWGSNPAPKSLFERTRSEAHKIQRTMYSRQMLPPMPQNGKSFTILTKHSNANVDFLPPTCGASRVTVNKVLHHRPIISTTSSKLATSPGTSSPKPTTSLPTSTPRPPAAPSNFKSRVASSPGQLSVRPDVSIPSESRPIHTQMMKPLTMKKDPMSSLFVPKRRVNSQLP